MASYAQTIILGNLGKDPEVRYLPGGEAVANFSVAVTEKWKDKASGEKREATTWYRCNAFGRLAEVIGEYVTKGMQVLVTGKMQQREWEKDGVKQYSWELRADTLQMMGGAEMRQSESKPTPKPASKAQKLDDMDDAVPF